MTKGSKDTSSIYCCLGTDDFGNVFSLYYLGIETCELCNICVPDQSILLLNVVVTDLVQAALK